MKPNESLRQFHQESFSPDVPIQSNQVFFALMNELNKLKQQGVSR